MAVWDWKALFLLHLLCAGLFLLFDLRGKARLRALTETAIVLAVPVAGLFIMCIFKAAGSLLNLWEVREAEVEAEEEVSFVGAPVQKDVVPLNDAFLVQDKLKKRKFFTESIKQSLVENQQILQMAMHDKDREVAYYAVSMLTSRMEKLEAELFERESKVVRGKQKENLGLLQEYAGLLREYLGNKNFIDHVSWRKKQEVYIGILNHLTNLTGDNKEYFREEIEQLLLLPDFPAAEQVCADFMEQHGEAEEPYLSYISVYVAWKKPDKMREILRRLKALPRDLSPEALRVIRFWDEGAAKSG